MLSTNSAPSARFDLHAKRYFLTYAQSGDVSKELLRDFLINERNVDWYIIGSEKHQDGNPHLHAYIEYNEQKRIRDPRYFDFHGVHPKIETVRNARNCQTYCTKEGDYIANMEIARGKRTYGEVITRSTTAQEFLVNVEEAFPRDMVINFERIRTYADYKWPRTDQEYTEEFSNFVVPETLTNWVEDNIYDDAAGR